MPPLRRRQVPLAAAACAAVAIGSRVRTARAEGAAGPAGYPSRPIRLIVPFPPGGGVDLAARLLAEPLSRDLDQAVVVENRAGGGGVVGVEAMARAAPDGHTLAMTSVGGITAGPHLRRLPYDAAALRHIARLVRMPFVLAARTDLPARDLEEFLATARAGREFRYASGGVGTGQHLTGELLRQMAGLRLVHVPYRGTGPALNDLAAKVVDVYFGDPSMLALVRQGGARALAVTSPERWPPLPDTPTVAEAVPGYASENWFGIAAPPGTPDEVVAFLHGRILRAMAQPEVHRRFEEAGLQPATMPLADYLAFLRADSETWARVVRAGDIRLDSE
jgi:tripartite-type tricarboxylate transporter receptor subunit TctC